MVANGSLVLDLEVDTMEFAREKEEIRMFPSMGKLEFFSNVTTSISRKYKITNNFQFARSLEIHFIRKTDKFTIGLWERKRMTGLPWFGNLDMN